ncbi:MAG: BamA/TamA family outer membrane protein [Prevotellaceae bacterium]|nr:BamA/TamA family outer membrane protein [Prevotellaceae bacterium]
MKKGIIITLLMLVSANCIYADSIDTLSIDNREANGFRKWLNSVIHGNIDKTHEQAIDMSLVVAPCYTREGSFGIGGAATALYRLDRKDSIMQPSDISLSGSAMLKGFYGLTVKGNNHFLGNRSRLSYRLAFNHKTLDFWGISYDACSNNAMSEYVRKQVKLEADYVYKLTKSLHVGIALNINYAHADKVLDMSYLEGQKDTYFFSGIGASLQYDTRDFILNPKRGVYIMVREVIYPKSLGSYNKTLFCTTGIIDAYKQAWSGAILALDLYGQFKNSSTPWALREELGSGMSRMRGYYAGRYIDCSQMTAQLELRQHIYSRIGCVAWAGCGTVFSSFKEIDKDHLLPNYGIGLRVEFKHNVNVRIDYGFGKDTAGFVFQFAEAF